MVKIKVFRAAPGMWRVLTPALRRDGLSSINEIHLGGWAPNGEAAVRLAEQKLQIIRRYLAAGWVAEA